MQARNTRIGDGPQYGRTPRARRSIACEPAAETSPSESSAIPTTNRTNLAAPAPVWRLTKSTPATDERREPAEDEQRRRGSAFDREGAGAGRSAGGGGGGGESNGAAADAGAGSPSGGINAPAARPGRRFGCCYPGGRAGSRAVTAGLRGAMRPVGRGRRQRLQGGGAGSRRSKSLPHHAHSDQSRPTSRLQFGQTRFSRVRHVGQMIHSSLTRRSQVGQ
jgi:hypothetical protein